MMDTLLPTADGAAHPWAWNVFPFVRSIRLGPVKGPAAFFAASDPK